MPKHRTEIKFTDQSLDDAFLEYKERVKAKTSADALRSLLSQPTAVPEGASVPNVALQGLVLRALSCLVSTKKRCQVF